MDTSTFKPPPAPQLILTVAGNAVFLDATDQLLDGNAARQENARDTEAVLAIVGRWLFAARRAAAGGA